ncbi:hypothetical protein O3597_19520 [Verrucosispora sp. WMMA2044]|uniref:hypothetical protein n=1 Tax=Verrucosispora sp. WMMA2044 TaxID=3016419 RepID=UPI00248D06C4|nr:hypothetical protein [Verrucosispora sp. WMMA2044]WBB47327.1 hypothetical protein O3597_19520 [Verrucosispora sp. WMMA2044]
MSKQTRKRRFRIGTWWRRVWRDHRPKVVAAVTLLVLPTAAAVIAQVAGNRLESAEHGPPVKARLLSVDRTRPAGFDWLFAEPQEFGGADLNSLAAAIESRDHKGIRERGGVDPLALSVSILIQGQRRAGTTITGLESNPVCGKPLSGALVYGPNPGGGPQKNPRIVFDLDQPDPRAADAKSLGSDYFQENSISLSKDEQVVVVVELRTNLHHCTVTLEVTANDGDRTERIAVDTEGRRLSVSGYADGAGATELVRDFGRYERLYQYQDGQVAPARPETFK